MTASILTGLPAIAVDAFLYGLLGALGGSIITWILAKHLFTKPLTDARRVILALEHSLRRHTDAIDAQTEQLQRLTRPTPQEEPR